MEHTHTQTFLTLFLALAVFAPLHTSDSLDSKEISFSQIAPEYPEASPRKRIKNEGRGAYSSPRKRLRRTGNCSGYGLPHCSVCKENLSLLTSEGSRALTPHSDHKAFSDAAENLIAQIKRREQFSQSISCSPTKKPYNPATDSTPQRIQAPVERVRQALRACTHTSPGKDPSCVARPRHYARKLFFPSERAYSEEEINDFHKRIVGTPHVKINRTLGTTEMHITITMSDQKWTTQAVEAALAGYKEYINRHIKRSLSSYTHYYYHIDLSGNYLTRIPQLPEEMVRHTLMLDLSNNPLMPLYYPRESFADWDKPDSLEFDVINSTFARDIIALLCVDSDLLPESQEREIRIDSMFGFNEFCAQIESDLNRSEKITVKHIVPANPEFCTIRPTYNREGLHFFLEAYAERLASAPPETRDSLTGLTTLFKRYYPTLFASKVHDYDSYHDCESPGENSTCSSESGGAAASASAASGSYRRRLAHPPTPTQPY